MTAPEENSTGQRIYPFLVDVKGSYSSQEQLGNSRGNSSYAHYVLQYMCEMLKMIPTLEVADFLIVVPFTEQAKLYRSVKNSNPGFKNLRICKVNSFEGIKAKITLVDCTIGADMSGLGGFVNTVRCTIMMERHKEAFMWFLDSLSLPQPDLPTDADGSKPFVHDMASLKAVYRRFEEN
jgi:hypothetical protein